MSLGCGYVEAVMMSAIVMTAVILGIVIYVLLCCGPL
jgi:hypothetical protein